MIAGMATPGTKAEIATIIRYTARKIKPMFFVSAINNPLNDRLEHPYCFNNHDSAYPVLPNGAN
jgi:hypothetical protein